MHFVAPASRRRFFCAFAARVRLRDNKSCDRVFIKQNRDSIVGQPDLCLAGTSAHDRGDGRFPFSWLRDAVGEKIRIARPIVAVAGAAFIYEFLQFI